MNNKQTENWVSLLDTLGSAFYPLDGLVRALNRSNDDSQSELVSVLEVLLKQARDTQEYCVRYVEQHLGKIAVNEPGYCGPYWFARGLKVGDKLLDGGPGHE